MRGVEGRRITMVLCAPTGEILGVLPEFEVSLPWWRDTTEPVQDARARFGLDVTILRLLEVDGDRGGAMSAVTVLAQLNLPIDVASVVETTIVSADVERLLADDPLRQAYARPGGPDADLAWAFEALSARGFPPTGTPEQQRTWNLSCIWRIPTAGGPVWLKVVPPFFAHESAMIHVVGSVLPYLPQVLASDRQRVLLADIPGADQYSASTPDLAWMVRTLVATQAALATNVDVLLATGCFDWREEPFSFRAHDVIERHAGELDPTTRASLDRLVRELPTRFAELASAGIPDSLVHGDFHPGNVRGDSGRLVLLDWGDSGVGHPLLDQAAFLQMVPAEAQRAITTEWAAAWRSAIPGCDPDHAANLVRPLSALRLAILYQLFLDQIEPSERVYHVNDPAIWLRNAAEATGMEGS
jgi:hypothetical protein